MRNIEIIIKGKVQGVGFRYHTMQIASEFNISGFVKNMHDGSVYLQAQGADHEIDMFIHWCRQGPRHAIVSSFELKEIEENDFKLNKENLNWKLKYEKGHNAINWRVYKPFIYNKKKKRKIYMHIAYIDLRHIGESGKSMLIRWVGVTVWISAF